MEKKLTCRAMGFNCSFEARGESEKDAVVKISDHLKMKHSVEFTEELKKKAIDLVRLAEAGRSSEDLTGSHGGGNKDKR